MSAKTSKVRRDAFFAALAETGNQTLAAERAKVSRSWMTLHRATDRAFRAAMDAAIATARARLAQAQGVEPAAAWEAQDGEELVIRGSNHRRAQLARARLKQWTPRLEVRFLQALAASCNVKASCQAAGLTQASAYAHRQRWPEFGRRWDEALEIGCMRVQTALVAGAGAMLGTQDYDPDAALLPTSFDQALQLLRLHQHRVHGIGNPPGRRARRRSLDEVRASILRKLEAVESARLMAAREAEQAAGAGSG